MRIASPVMGAMSFAALVGMSGVFPGARRAWTLYPSRPVIISMTLLHPNSATHPHCVAEINP